MNFCENTLEDSNRAAFRFGPQMRNPLAWNKSTTPSASGLSGPTTVSAAFFSSAKASREGRSSAAMPAHSTAEPLRARLSRAMPALPGAHHNFVMRGDCANFQTSACSRPPEPMTKTFIASDSIRNRVSSPALSFCNYSGRDASPRRPGGDPLRRRVRRGQRGALSLPEQLRVSNQYLNEVLTWFGNLF